MKTYNDIYFEVCNTDTHSRIASFGESETGYTLEQVLNNIKSHMLMLCIYDEDIDQSITLAVTKKIQNNDFEVVEDINLYIAVKFTNSELEEIQNNTKYEFEVFQKGTLNYLATWECTAKSAEDAFVNFILQLSDFSICEDKYEEAIHRAIMRKIIRIDYEEDCEWELADVIRISFALDEEEINRYL